MSGKVVNGKEKALAQVETALRRLKRKENWIRGVMAATADGITVEPNSEAARRWCLIGACITRPGLNATAPAAHHEIGRTLTSMGVEVGPILWNDDVANSLAEVRSVLHATAKRLREELAA